MGREIVYCSVCGDLIPSKDFQKGVAVTALERHYCKKCAVKVAKESPDNQSPGPDETPKTKIRTQRTLPAQRPGLENFRVPFLIAAVVGLVALLLLLYVIFGKRS
jgi:hypothetical protein